MADIQFYSFLTTIVIILVCYPVLVNYYCNVIKCISSEQHIIGVGTGGQGGLQPPQKFATGTYKERSIIR